MILYTAIALITVLAVIPVSNCRPVHTGEKIYGITRQQLVNRICITAVFVVLFLLCALRIEVGNDYITYVQNAHEIYVGGITVTEWGYNLVVKLLFALSGYENFLLVFAFFGFFTILIFLKAMYDQSEFFVMSFMLFMALGIYFRSFSTVRYYFALAITLFSLRYVVRKEYLKFIIIIVAAAFFHKSVLAVIPMYLICNMVWKRWLYAVIAVGAATIYVLRDYVMELALKLYPSYRDTIYLTQDIGIRESIPALIRCGLVIVLCLFFFNETIRENRSNILCFNMTVLAVALYIGGSFLPMVSRFGYYLITPQILLIPGVYKAIDDEKKKRLVFWCILIFAAVYFAYFLYTASNPGIAVLPYRSWLFRELEWNNIEDMLIYNNR